MFFVMFVAIAVVREMVRPTVIVMKIHYTLCSKNHVTTFLMIS